MPGCKRPEVLVTLPAVQLQKLCQDPVRLQLTNSNKENL